MFLLKRKHKQVAAKKKSAFNGSESESDDDDRFRKAMKSKEAKVSVLASKTAVNEHSYIEAELQSKKPQIDAKLLQKLPTQTTLKYIGGLVNAANERRKTFESARNQAQQRQVDTFEGMVFESHEYKQIQKEKQILLEQSDEDVQEDKKGDSVLFYNRILDAKLGNASAILPQNDLQLVNNTSDSRTKSLSTASTTKSRTEVSNTVSSGSTGADPELYPGLSEIIKSTMTPQLLNEYKKRYWERQGLETC